MRILLTTLLLSMSLVVYAQDKGEKDKKEKKEKTIEDLTKSSRMIDGLFPIYQDTITGELKMIISHDQLDKDFIYFSQIADGVTEAGSFRGSYGADVVFNIKKYFNKIEFVAPNTNFYFDKDNPLSRSKDANMSHAIISSNKIIKEDIEDKRILINVNDLFLSETLRRVKPPRYPGSSSTRFTLGSFDKGKSKVKEINNYPRNTNLKTEYVYKNPGVLNSGSEAVTDGRYVSIEVFHSMMAMPEDGYEIRYDDPRVGYFLTSVNDMTETGTTNYRDMVNRWRLIKKNPELEISEPVTPITWWIENSTPLEWRETIEEGVLEWNEAFEKAGFKNALVVKTQPDDAEWDAGDIRYNVLRWTSSPNPPFGGYGPSMTNPRTGEIIAVSYTHLTLPTIYSV